MRHRRAGWLLIAVLLLTISAYRPVEAGGTGVPALLIHGFGGSPESTWGQAVPVFEQAGYRQGQTLFAVRLSTSVTDPLELFRDAGVVKAEIERIRRETGAAQVDLVGHSRGGLIARILAAGESAALVRRAVAIDTPHEGILPEAAIDAMLKEAQVPVFVRALLPLPAHLRAGSPALATLKAREARFGDQRSPALTIGSSWQEGALPVLEGHDGIVSLESQLAWPWATSRTFRLGPSPEALAAQPDPLLIAWQSPHAVSHDSPAVLRAVIEFLQAAEVPAPARPCGSACADWTDLTGHWAGPALRPHLPGRLPYTLAADGRRLFEPDRPMTRAAFVYGLIKMKGLTEQLQTTPFADLAGHWSLGYVEAARAAALVNGLTPDRFGPDQALTRAQAATLVARALGLPPAGPGRFADMAGKGHWAEGSIEAVAALGIVKGDARGFRPDDPVTMAEGAVILVQAFGPR